MTSCLNKGYYYYERERERERERNLKERADDFCNNSQRRIKMQQYISHQQGWEVFVETIFVILFD
jgi:hypothetical protein